MEAKRMCGNCCYCKADEKALTGICVMSKKHDCVKKASTAEEMKCKNHLFKAVQNELN